MRDWFTKDFYWKAFSLLMAIGIWLTVRKEVDATSPRVPASRPITYGNVPVVATSNDGNVHVAQLVPNTVTVTISGTTEVMDTLQRSQLRVFVDLTGLNSAQNLSRDVEMSLPRGATIVNIDPPSVAVTLPKQP